MCVGHISGRGVLLILAAAVAAPIIIDAQSVPASADVEARLERGDRLSGDESYWEALEVYEGAKEEAGTEQLVRASAGLLRSLLRVGEFARAHEEAVFLVGLGTPVPDSRALYADALWASGLFPEADRAYAEVLAVDPGNTVARHGLARSLATRGRLEDALAEVQAAIAGDDRATYYLTLGTMYRRLGRYEEAADALERYISRRPRARAAEERDVTRSEVRFLRSFGDRTPIQISPEQLDEVHTIPFRLQGNKVIVRARVNGRDPMDLVVDTGAEQMVLSKPLAQRVGVRSITSTVSAGVGRGFRGLELGRVETLEVGTLRVSNVPTIINNPQLKGLPKSHIENSFSPLALGLSMIIDYESRYLLLGRDLPDEPVDIEMPMRFSRLATVRGVINDEHPKSFIVDTGGEAISISFGAAMSLGMAPVRHIPLLVYGTAGWDPDAFVLPGVDLAFDRVQYDDFGVVVLNLHRVSAVLGFHIGGIIGHKFLHNYRVGIDLADSVVRLTELEPPVRWAARIRPGVASASSPRTQGDSSPLLVDR